MRSGLNHGDNGSRARSELLDGTRVMKMKIYDLGGLAVFSNVPSQIRSSYLSNFEKGSGFLHIEGVAEVYGDITASHRLVRRIKS